MLPIQKWLSIWYQRLCNLIRFIGVDVFFIYEFEKLITNFEIHIKFPRRILPHTIVAKWYGTNSVVHYLQFYSALLAMHLNHNLCGNSICFLSHLCALNCVSKMCLWYESKGCLIRLTHWLVSKWNVNITDILGFEPTLFKHGGTCHFIRKQKLQICWLVSRCQYRQQARCIRELCVGYCIRPC